MQLTTQRAASIILAESIKKSDVVTLTRIIRQLAQVVLTAPPTKASKLKGLKSTVIDLKTKSDRFSLLLANKVKDEKSFIETISLFAGLTEACLRIEDYIATMDAAGKIVAENKAKQQLEKDSKDINGSAPTPQTTTTPPKTPSGVQLSPTSGNDNNSEDTEPLNPILQTVESFLGADAQKYRSYMKECLSGTNKLSKDTATVAFRKVIAATGTKVTEIISKQARQTIPLQTLKLTVDDFNVLLPLLLPVAARIKAYRTNLGSSTMAQLKTALGAPENQSQP